MQRVFYKSVQRQTSSFNSCKRIKVYLIFLGKFIKIRILDKEKLYVEHQNVIYYMEMQIRWPIRIS